MENFLYKNKNVVVIGQVGGQVLYLNANNRDTAIKSVSTETFYKHAVKPKDKKKTLTVSGTKPVIKAKKENSVVIVSDDKPIVDDTIPIENENSDASELSSDSIEMTSDSTTTPNDNYVDDLYGDYL